jgi:hypothetical protein
MRVAKHLVGRSMQGAVLGVGAQCAQHPRGDAGAPRGIVDPFAQVWKRRCLQTH